MRSFLPLGVLVLLAGLFSMPADLYVGDANAVRKETIHLLNAGRWGIPSPLRGELGELAVERGQYFFENGAESRLFSKYGVLNTLLYVPPLLAEKIWTGRLPLAGTSPSLLLFLNLYNVLLSLLLAYILYRLAAARTASPWIPAAYVLACLYTTFLWNYLRAQTLEIFQVLFFAAFAACLSGPAVGRKRGLLAGLCLSALVLTKTYYALFFLPVAAYFFWRGEKEALLSFALSAGCAAIILLWTNQHKFGSPWATGYGQWLAAGRPHDRFGGAFFFQGLKGFLFSQDRSVFLHFPLLFPALAGILNRDAKLRPFLYLIAALSLLSLFSLSCFSNWPGHASYGPRYLLFILPVLSLPAISTSESILKNKSKFTYTTPGVCFLIFLSASFFWQIRVNALPFFTYYRIAGPFASYGDPDIDRYFRNRHFGRINGDLLDHMEGKTEFYPVKRLRESKGSAEAETVAQKLREIATPNNYWKTFRAGRRS